MDIKQNFNCSQQELLTASSQIWQSFIDRLMDFTAFKPRYKMSTADENRQLIDQVNAMPNEKARSLLHQSVNQDLRARTPGWLNLYQRLKRYIVDAWPKMSHKPYFEAAGGNYYAGASNYNWESMRDLFNAMRNFITLYKMDLTANENMPEIFENLVKDEQTVFVLLHDTFLNKKEQANQLRNQRTEALNQVYSNTIAVCKDAQEMFPKDSAAYKLFVFEDVLRNISGYGQAGLSGQVTDAVTEQPIAGVIVTIFEKSRSEPTNEEGRFEMLVVAAGFYRIIFSKDGYQTLILDDYEVKAGTVGRLDVQLTPELVPQ